MGSQQRFTRRRRVIRQSKRVPIKGGFYPSVMEGVRTSAVLLPIVARQAYRLYNRKAVKAVKAVKAKKTRKTVKARRNGTARRG